MLCHWYIIYKGKEKERKRADDKKKYLHAYHNYIAHLRQVEPGRSWIFYTRSLARSLAYINSYITNDTEQWSLFYHQKSNDKLADAFIFRMRARRLFSFSFSLSSVKMTHTHHWRDSRYGTSSADNYNLCTMYLLVSYRATLGIPRHLQIIMRALHKALSTITILVERIVFSFTSLFDIPNRTFDV